MRSVQHETSKRFEVSTDNEINWFGKRKLYIYFKSFVKWPGIYWEKRCEKVVRRQIWLDVAPGHTWLALAKQVIGRVVVVVRFYFDDDLKCVSAACYDKLTIRYMGDAMEAFYNVLCRVQRKVSRLRFVSFVAKQMCDWSMSLFSLKNYLFTYFVHIFRIMKIFGLIQCSNFFKKVV